MSHAGSSCKFTSFQVPHFGIQDIPVFQLPACFRVSNDEKKLTEIPFIVMRLKLLIQSI